MKVDGEKGIRKQIVKGNGKLWERCGCGEGSAEWAWEKGKQQRSKEGKD